VKLFRVAMVALSLAAASCGEGDDPGDSDVVAIRGGERLAWDQTAPSLSALQRYTFNLYVDNAARSFAGIADCSAGASGAAAFVCSGRLPPLARGMHVLQVASVLDGVESARSAAFRVSVESSSAAGSTAMTRLSATGRRVACLDARVDDCYDAHLVASHLDAVQDLVLAPDGRVVLIEGSRRVRVVRESTLLPGSALAVDPDAAALVSLAIGPDFPHTRHLYVGSIERWPGGRREFFVTRYRELQGTLGEGAVVLAGLPVAGEDRVPIAVDQAGFLYVALPAADPAEAMRGPLAWNGSLLRFTAEGATPDGQSSPMLEPSYRRPAALLFDPAGPRLWIAGSGAATRGRVASISLEGGRGDRSPLPAGAHPSHPRAVPDVVWLALRGSGAAAAPRTVWAVTPEGLTYRAVASNGTVGSFAAVVTGAGRVDALIDGPAGDAYVVVRSDGAGHTGERTLLRLVPRR
jgi:hypothetical protein